MWILRLLCALTIAFLPVRSASAQSLGDPSNFPSVSGTVLSWPATERNLTITLEGPTGEQLRATFGPFETPSLDLAELGELVDGTYVYSLRRGGARDSFDSTHPIQERAGGEVSVRNGLLLGETREPPASGPGQIDEPPGQARVHTKRQQTVTDSGPLPAFFLEDTSVNGGGTDDDWYVLADYSTSEGFSVYWDPDHGGLGPVGTSPFVIERDINSHALYLDGGGKTGFAQVGINTNVPDHTLHLTDTFPAIMFDDVDGQRWWVAGSDNSFNVTNWNRSQVPFVIQPEALGFRMVLSGTGVGIDTDSPQGNLHISGSGSADVFAGIGPDLIAGPAFNFGYSGSSFGEGSGFFNVRPAAGATSPGPALYFMTRNVERLVVDRDGSLGVDMDSSFGNTWDPQHPIESQRSGAHLSAAGVWTNASSRALKENVQTLPLATALEALAALEPVRFNYRAVPEDEQIGFIAEDVPELVATPDRKSLAPTDIVGVLTRVVQHQQEQNGQLRGDLERLRETVLLQQESLRLLEEQVRRGEATSLEVTVTEP